MNEEESQNILFEMWNAHQEQLIGFGKAILVALVIVLFGWLLKMAMNRLIAKMMKKHPNVDISLVAILNKIVNFLVGGVVVLMLLDRCGVNTSSILTVVGASALAVGIALKDTLSNIAAGIFLLCQHPYKTSDYVDCGTVSGTISEIGLFTTRLMTPQGQVIFVPNNSIMVAPVVNYSSNELRRADINVSISYNDNIDNAVDVLMKMLDNCVLVEHDPSPDVLVVEYGDNGVKLDLRYWTKNENYWDAYWLINHKLKKTLEDNGITIPYPQIVVHEEKKNSNVI